MKAVIFDMDGLMFDTENLWIKLSKKVALKFNIKLQDKIIYKVIGMTEASGRETFKKEFGESFNYTEFINAYYSEVKEYIKSNGTPIKKGLIELLNYLKSNNYKIALASSSNKEKINFYLKYANINEDVFDVIVSGDDVKCGKPNPEIFLKAIDKLMENAKNCYILEDSNNGINAAFSSGAIAVLIPDKDEIKEENLEKAQYIFNSLLEFKNFLEG